jgi:hypothetical protein
MTTPFRAELVSVRRSPWILGLAALPLATFLAFGFSERALNPILFLLIVVGALAAGGVWLTDVSLVRRTRLVTADAGGISVGDVRVPRAALSAGFVKPEAGAPRVLLRRRRGLPIELEAGSTDEARALLMALGLDASQTAVDFRTPSPIVGDRWASALAGIAMGFVVLAAQAVARVGPHVVGPAFMTMILIFIALASVSTRLRIGADGVETRWLRRRRFIPYEQFAGAQRYSKSWGRSRIDGLRITLRTGETVDLPVQVGSWWRGDKLMLVEERIREAKEAYRRGDAAVDAAMLERGGRSVGEWVAALRAIGTGANATLRVAPLPRDRLLRIVEDATQPGLARAAAAVAVGAEMDEEGRARLRVAAEATAATKLRVSIERAASGASSPELEEALSELAAGESAGRRAG